MPVQLFTAKLTDVTDRSTYVGTLKSRRFVTLQPQVEGRILKIFVRSGDLVSEGTPLMEIDPAKQEASVNSFIAAAESSKADKANAMETLRSLEANRQSKLSNMNFMQQQRDRYASLAAQGAVSRESVDTYENNLRQARAEVDGINALIKAQQAAIDRSEKAIQKAMSSTTEQQVQLRYYTVNAPFGGMVGDVPVRIGEYVTTSTILTTVTQNRPLELYVRVPAEKAATLKKGTRIEVLNGSEGLIESGQVFFIAPNVDTDSQSVLVKAICENAHDQLRSEQEVTARVIWSKHPGLLLPTGAVQRISGQDFVFVTESSKKYGLVARQRAVRLGEIEGNSFQVISGLKSGDQIVVSGVQSLADGLPVKPRS